MKNKSSGKKILFLILPLLFLLPSCGVYTLNGGSVGALKTVNVMFFENVAPLVINNLSQSFTQALQDRVRNQTKLSTVRGEADATFEGRITGYTIAPTILPAATSTTNTAPIANTNRLTITVSVKYTNSLDPKSSFDQSFSRFVDYQGDISTQEQTLIQNLNKQLTEDIFNKAFANW